MRGDAVALVLVLVAGIGAALCGAWLFVLGRTYRRRYLRRLGGVTIVVAIVGLITGLLAILLQQ